MRLDLPDRPDIPPPPQPPEPEDELPSDLLSDLAIATEADDAFNLNRIAQSLAEFINNRNTKTPFVLAINAPWGAGKTSLTNLIQRKLEFRSSPEKLNRFIRDRQSPFWKYFVWWLQNRPEGSTLQMWGCKIERSRLETLMTKHTVCTFNAWHYDDSPNQTGTFAQFVTRKANDARRLPNQILRATSWRQTSVGANILRVLSTLLIASWAGVGVIWLYASWPWFFEQSNALLAMWNLLPKIQASGGLAIPALITALTPLLNKARNAFDSVNKFIADPEKVAADGQIHRVRERLGGLIQQATSKGRRFVIVVDDLERCKPENTLAVLDLVNQLLSHPNVVVIVSGDMTSIAASAGSKYKEQAKLLANADDEKQACLEYGRRYLQKVVQMQFELPPPDPVDLPKLTEKLQNRQPPAPPEGGWVIGALRGAGYPVGLAQKATLWVLRKLFPPRATAQDAATIASLDLTPQEEEELREQANVSKEAVEQAKRQEKESRVATRAAIEFLTTHFELTPRQVKRYENVLRVYFKILRGQEVVLRGNLPLQVAKWVYLQDCWPIWSDRIALEKDFLKEIEKVAINPKELREKLGAVPECEALMNVLKTLPHLNDAREILIRMRSHGPNNNGS